MTIQQLEYILAVDQFRHFARAAEYCRVTQPTLSAMIQKLEDELGVKLFDRTVQPVCPVLGCRRRENYGWRQRCTGFQTGQSDEEYLDGVPERVPVCRYD